MPLLVVLCSSKKSMDFQAYLLDLDQKLHRDRVAKTKHEVDTVEPPKYPHLSQNLKGKQIQMELHDDMKRISKIQDARVAATTSITKFPPMAGRRRSARGKGATETWPEKLERAILNGDLPLLSMATAHVPVGAQLKSGWFPIVLAAATGKSKVLCELLKLGADPRPRGLRTLDGSELPQEGKKGQDAGGLDVGGVEVFSALQIAASRGHVSCVHELLRAGHVHDIQAACVQTAENRRLPLSKQLAVIKRLLAYESRLILAISHGCLRVLCGADESEEERLDREDEMAPQLLSCYRRLKARLTALDTLENALQEGSISSIEQALGNSFLCPEMEGWLQIRFEPSGLTPLGVLAAGNHVEAAELLLARGGADVTTMTMADGRTAVEVAAQAQHLEVTAFLLSASEERGDGKVVVDDDDDDDGNIDGSGRVTQENDSGAISSSCGATSLVESQRVTDYVP